MNCRRVLNLMSAYVDGELTGVEMLEIRRHLSECPECAEEHESIRTTKLLVSRLRTMAPSKNLAVSIVVKLDEVRIPRYQRVANSLSRYLHSKLSPVAAALAASGLALVIMSAGGVDNGAVVQNNDMSEPPVVAASYGQGASFASNTYAMPAGFSSEPLKIAQYSTVPEQAAPVRLASFSTR